MLLSPAYLQKKFTAPEVWVLLRLLIKRSHKESCRITYCLINLVKEQMEESGIHSQTTKGRSWIQGKCVESILLLLIKSLSKSHIMGHNYNSRTWKTGGLAWALWREPVTKTSLKQSKQDIVSRYFLDTMGIWIMMQRQGEQWGETSPLSQVAALTMFPHCETRREITRRTQGTSQVQTRKLKAWGNGRSVRIALWVPVREQAPKKKWQRIIKCCWCSHRARERACSHPQDGKEHHESQGRRQNTQRALPSWGGVIMPILNTAWRTSEI